MSKAISPFARLSFFGPWSAYFQIVGLFLQMIKSRTYDVVHRLVTVPYFLRNFHEPLSIVKVEALSPDPAGGLLSPLPTPCLVLTPNSISPRFHISWLSPVLYKSRIFTSGDRQTYRHRHSLKPPSHHEGPRFNKRQAQWITENHKQT